MGSFLFQVSIALFFLVSFSAHATTSEDLILKARSLKLWENRQWLYLVHYRPGLFGGQTSQADGKEFFLSPEGKTDPEAEMVATLREYFRAPTAVELAIPETASSSQAKTGEPSKDVQPELPPQHPLCRFPARYRFLKRELGWDGKGVPAVTCHRLEDFRRRVDAQSVSLVFSSFYLNNPSSTFGHSFIRINSGIWSQYGNYRNELLDTGINYAANANMANPVLYAFFGIAGFFPGTFTAVPYYYKVREYNDYESRDLWSYDLDLTKDEITMLVDHIWEEGSASYDYYYFTENCSYHMFTLLDAAAPRYALQERLAFYVIPSNTIRVLYRTPGIVTRVTYRPSILSQFRHRLSLFNADEVAAFDRLLKSKDPSSLDASLSKESQAKILDAYSDQVELTAGEDLLKEGSESQKMKQKILLQRATLGVKSPPLEVSPPERSAPHLAHGMRRASLGYATDAGRGDGVTLGFKFAMHELLDPGLGYPRNTQIDFGQAHLRIRDGIEFDEIGIFKITALTPYSSYYPSKSVRAELGWKKSIDRDCEKKNNRCLPLTLNYAPGVSFDPTGDEAITFSAFFGGRVEYSPNFVGSNLRIGAGPRVSALVHFSDVLRFEIGSEIYGRIWAREDFQYLSEAALRYGFFEAWAIDVAAKRGRDWSEAASRVHFYF